LIYKIFLMLRRNWIAQKRKRMAALKLTEKALNKAKQIVRVWLSMAKK